MLKTNFTEQPELQMLELLNYAKLSVSSVKYFKGHDGDCMSCNVKLNNKIVGTCFDDSYGGEFIFEDKNENIKVEQFTSILESIAENGPKSSFKNTSFTFSIKNMQENLAS
jgi:hypothetical protein